MELVFESRIEDEFEGWDGDTSYELDNGSKWQLVNTNMFINIHIDQKHLLPGWRAVLFRSRMNGIKSPSNTRILNIIFYYLIRLLKIKNRATSLIDNNNSLNYKFIFVFSICEQ